MQQRMWLRIMQNDNRNIDFLDLLTMMGFAMQIMNYQEIKNQTNNDDLMEELQKQDREYLEKIIQNQKMILDRLAKLESK